MRAIVVNGKFCAQRTTGVQRVAAELLRAADARLPAGTRLLHPRAGRPPVLARVAARALGPARLPLHLWEQAWLPAAARGALLVNLAGAAPALASRQLCLVHDAAVFDHPEAYTRAFVAWYRRLFSHLARRARLATVSRFSQQRLALHLGLAEEAIAVLPNGGDHLARTEPEAGLLARLGLEPGRFLLAVGSANPTKNLPALVRAHARAGFGPALPLVIAGGRHAAVFADERAAADETDPPGVLRTGPLGDAALKALYLGARGLVFPSLYEGFGLPPLEAMHCGCPVAASRAASMPEVCGDAALYFDPHDEADMAQALRRLADDAALRADLRERGLRRAAAFGWDATAGALVALVNEAAAA